MADEGTIGTIAGTLFLLCLFGIPLAYFWYSEGMKRREREIKMEEICRHSTSIPAWKDSEVSVIEMPNQPVQIKGRFSPEFCQHLTKLSSVMIKCPSCQHTFLRLFPKFDVMFTPAEYSNLKEGTLSLTDIFRKRIRENGCPSTFTCPQCNVIIVRSREPSGMCQLYNKRVYGEKLFCCIINQCI